MNINLKELKNCVIIDEWIYRDIITDNYKLRELVEEAKDIFSLLNTKIDYTNFEMVDDTEKLMKYLSEIKMLIEDFGSDK